MIVPSRPIQLPHTAEFLSPKTYEKIREAINDMIGNEYACILEAEGRNSESALNFCAGSSQEYLENRFHAMCTQAIWEVVYNFQEEARKEL